MNRLLITICGRAGSKGFKNKNLKVFCGKPLVYYSLSAAELFIKNHPELTVDIALNTDSEDLAKLVAAEYPEVVYLPRGAELGGDRVPKMAVYQDSLRRMEARQASVEEKIEEIRLVNRAKWLLIERLGMTEAEAHRYMEKQAMDQRVSKRGLAEIIIKTYE